MVKTGVLWSLVRVSSIWIRLVLAGMVLEVALSTAVMAAPNDFDEAKRLAERVYADHPEEFYCGCRITWRKSGKDLVDWGSCGYRVRKDPVRAQRIEWEHVVPASWFGQPMTCWKKGGRQNCSRNDVVFQRMEADLHNLAPSVGEVNGDRGNLPFGVVGPDKARYGKCATRVDMTAGRVEPRDAVKGDVARIAFYMADRYKVTLDAGQLQVLVQWAQQDPVDQWERQRDERIGQHMGWRNPYVAKAGSIALPALPSGDVGKGKSVGGHVDAPVQPGQRRVTLSVPSVASASEDITGAVRGNRNSKLYHLAHCPGYANIKPGNRVEFTSVADAQANGYRLAGNCR